MTESQEREEIVCFFIAILQFIDEFLIVPTKFVLFLFEFKRLEFLISKHHDDLFLVSTQSLPRDLEFHCRLRRSRNRRVFLEWNIY